MPANPSSMTDQAARLRDAAKDAGCRAAASWAPDALLEAARQGSVGPCSGFCSAARELADGLVELQSLRAKVADLHNLLTPLLVAADLFEMHERPTGIIGERTIECDWKGVDGAEGMLAVLHTLSQIPARWRRHQEQHGNAKQSNDEGQGTQAREGVQDQAGQEGTEAAGEGQGEQADEAGQETRW